MRNLLIEQRGPSGLLKTWRIRPDQELVTFGTSKHADLRSPEPSVKGIQGLFEFRDGKWRYVNLDLNQSNISEPVEQLIDKDLELPMGHSRLHLVPYEARTRVLSQLDSAEFSQQRPNTKAYQFYAVYHEDNLLETQILPLNRSFKTVFDATQTNLSAQQSSTWTRVPVGNLIVAQRTIYLTSVQALSMVTKDQLYDKNAKPTIIAVLAGIMLLFVFFLISPSSRDAAEVARNATPPEFKEARLVLPKNKKAMNPVPQKKQAPSSQAKTEQPKAGPAPSNNRMSAIKSLSASRISQLLGKVSTATAKSANAVAGAGVEAGSQASGSALSAVGKVASAGKDWGAEGKSGGVAVSTVGRSGGTGGMGSLATGKTGSGGAELLEEEGEISGGLDREVIAQYIKTQLGQILYCYERQLSATPDLYGKATVRFTIGPTGGVETQRISETTLKNANVENCMLQKIAKWKFPAPQGGTRVMVTYPFLFKSTN